MLRSIATGLVMFSALQAFAQDVLPPTPGAAEPGTWQAQVKVGPTFRMSDFVDRQFRGSLSVGMSFDSAHRFYLVLPIDLGAGGGVTLLSIIPVLEAHFEPFDDGSLLVYPLAGAGLGFFFGGG